MDTSLNSVDLLYLTKPSDLGKIYKKMEVGDCWRERISDITMQMLKGKKINTIVDSAFEQYVDICIRHFKFMDKAATIQTDYLNMEKSRLKKIPDYSVEEANKIILRKKNPTIRDFAEVKKHPPPPFYPKIRKL